VRQEWEPEDVIALLEDEVVRLRNKTGANRLGFALLLKFFEVEARFPENAGEVPAPAVAYVAQQVKVPAEERAAYAWQGRAITRHRTEIRTAFGFRAGTEEDQERLAEWLAADLFADVSEKLYRPAAGQDEKWPHLAPVLSIRTINWELIAQQYDQIVKYTTALRLGTAEAEQVLRRFPRRPQAPHLPGDRRAGARGAHGVCVRLPRGCRDAARDPRRTPGCGELELREQGPLLRQGRRPGRCGQGIPGGPRRTGPAHSSGGKGLPCRGEVWARSRCGPQGNQGC
jgi:hypothetical protein